jgi:hypothetical protein
MQRIFAVILSVCLPAIAIASTQPAAAPQRLRGTIETVTPASVTLQTRDGTSETLILSSKTRFAILNTASVNAILPESYIGTAAKGSGANMIALEVVIFPPAMRGDGEGHYPWDPLPDVTAPTASAASSMTNGSVSNVMATAKVGSSMTNGSVQTVSALPGAKQISVVYPGGKQIILVLPSTPVVALQPATHAALTPGAQAFAVALDENGKLIALYIATGAKGVRPPM